MIRTPACVFTSASARRCDSGHGAYTPTAVAAPAEMDVGDSRPAVAARRTGAGLGRRHTQRAGIRLITGRAAFAGGHECRPGPREGGRAIDGYRVQTRYSCQ